MNNDLYNDNIYVVEKDDSYFIINIDSLNIIALSKKDLYKNGELNPLVMELSQQDSFLKRLDPVIVNSKINPHIVTSFNCNYSCSYCYQRDMKAARRKLEAKDVEKIKFFYDSYCNEMNIQEEFGGIYILGGEPFLLENRDTLEAIAQTWPNTTLTFTTNGTYLDKFIDFIKSNKTSIRISLDGTKEMHYKYRKTKEFNAYEKTIEAMRLLLGINFEIQVVTVFHPCFWHEYPKFFNQMEKMGWLQNDNLKIAFIPKIGYGCDDISNVTEIIEAYLELARLDNRVKFVDTRKLFPGSINLISSLKMAKSENSYECYRCSCLYSPDYCFLPDGTVHFCMMSNDSQTEIGRYTPKIEINKEKIKLLQARRFDLHDKCIKCKYKVFCKGGCPITALSKTKSVSGFDCSLWERQNFLQYFDNVLNLRRG